MRLVHQTHEFVETPMSLVRLLVMVLSGIAASALPAVAQQPKVPAKKKAAENSAYAPVQDVPGLPRVLLIGDSISIGYTVPTRESLKGKANVHRPATNCGPTSRGVEQIDEWLGDGKWDVIHFNFGLHDVRYFEDGKASDAGKGQRQVNQSDYEKNLEQLVGRMKRTGAKLIFATTTPVPEGSAGRIKGEEVKYNEIALRVMHKHGVVINDLYAFTLPRLAEMQRPANVHFTPEGSERLAAQVSASISKSLESK
jgi:acyl-CoA thioesterase-1